MKKTVELNIKLTNNLPFRVRPGREDFGQSKTGMFFLAKKQRKR
jgi:hypothetical protein